MTLHQTFNIDPLFHYPMLSIVLSVCSSLFKNVKDEEPLRDDANDMVATFKVLTLDGLRKNSKESKTQLVTDNKHVMVMSFIGTSCFHDKHVFIVSYCCNFN